MVTMINRNCTPSSVNRNAPVPQLHMTSQFTRIVYCQKLNVRAQGKSRDFSRAGIPNFLELPQGRPCTVSL